MICGRSRDPHEDDSTTTKKIDAVANLTLSDQERQCLLRCLPEDETNGFFVAVFRRPSNRNMVSEEKKRSRKRKNNAHEDQLIGDSGGPNLKSDRAKEVQGQSKKKGKVVVAKESLEVASEKKPDQGRSLFEGKKFRVRAFSKAKTANRKR